MLEVALVSCQCNDDLGRARARVSVRAYGWGWTSISEFVPGGGWAEAFLLA